MITESYQHIAETRKIKIARLHKLEVQASTFGVSCPPEITLEIESLRAEISERKLVESDYYYEENKEILAIKRKELYECQGRMRKLIRLIEQDEKSEIMNIVRQNEFAILKADIDDLVPEVNLLDSIVYFDERIVKKTNVNRELLNFIDQLIDICSGIPNGSKNYSSEYDIAFRSAKRFAVHIIDNDEDKFIIANANLYMAKLLWLSRTPKPAIWYCDESIANDNYIIDAYDLLIEIWTELEGDLRYKTFAKKSKSKIINKRRDVRKQLKIGQRQE